MSNGSSAVNASDVRAICRHYARGYCAYDDKCKFLHCAPGSDEYVRIFGDAEYVELKTKLCRHFTSGYCALGDQCKFIHSSRARVGRFQRNSHLITSRQYRSSINPSKQQNNEEEQQQDNSNGNEVNEQEVTYPSIGATSPSAAVSNNQQQQGAGESSYQQQQQGQMYNNQVKVKQEICRYYYHTGACRYGDSCHYIHQRGAPYMQSYYPHHHHPHHPSVNIVPPSYQVSSMNGIPPSSMMPHHNPIVSPGTILPSSMYRINNYATNIANNQYKNHHVYPTSGYIMQQDMDGNHQSYYDGYPNNQVDNINRAAAFGGGSINGYNHGRGYDNNIAQGYGNDHHQHHHHHHQMGEENQGIQHQQAEEGEQASSIHQ